MQGDFERHLYRLELIDIPGYEVRRPGDLNGLDGLIIPGGESTTMTELIDRFGLRKPLIEFGREKAVWGTCAGMIMVSVDADDPRVKPLGLIDIKVLRNGYGRQVHSFFADIDADLEGKKVTLSATFIRAPKIVQMGEGIKIMASWQDTPVLISKNNILASSFHTELDEDPTLTRFFVEKFVSFYK